MPAMLIVFSFGTTFKRASEALFERWWHLQRFLTTSRSKRLRRPSNNAEWFTVGYESISIEVNRADLDVYKNVCLSIDPDLS